MDYKLSKIIMVENYMETLRQIPAGETRIYKVLHCDVPQGFRMAKSRMKKQGIEFIINLIDEKKKIKITRQKK